MEKLDLFFICKRPNQKAFSFFLLLMLLVFVLSCKKQGKSGENTKEFFFDFAQGKQSWQAFFSDYPVGAETYFELVYEQAGLPAPLDPNITALKISGNNHSDDLLSFIYRKFEGLTPDKTYSVVFDINLASNTPTNAVGVGGDPNLALGAGGISYAPVNMIDVLNTYRPNFPSTLQGHLSNEVLKVIGHIGVSDNVPSPYTLINRNNKASPINLRANDRGELWVMVGTDSGYESTTTLYFKTIKVTLY